MLRIFDNRSKNKEKTWATVQEKLILAPVLHLPRGKGHLTLDMDACKQIGSVFFQEYPEGT